MILGIVGWRRWRHGIHGELAVRSGSYRLNLSCIATVLVGTAVLYQLLRWTHDSAPFLDALTTSLSLVAQWLLNGKWIQTWYFWIAADYIYIPLYLSRGLNLTAVVYALFLTLCVAGLRSWSREHEISDSKGVFA